MTKEAGMFLLKVGSWRRGNPSYIQQVRDWQRFLRTQGFDIEVDGDFGEKTAAATSAFQRSHGLLVDGIAGQETFTAAEADGFGRGDPVPDDGGPAPRREDLAKVKGMDTCSPEFLDEVVAMARRLGTDPNYLMAVMSFESGETFSPSVKNPGTSATGLIQFMASTARSLGTTTQALAQMSAVQQLKSVEKYFQPYRNKLSSLEDCYMAVLWPRAVGKANSYILFRRPSKAYTLNSGLDIDKRGTITKAEAAAKVRSKILGKIDAQLPDPGPVQPDGAIAQKGDRGEHVREVQEMLLKVRCLSLVHFNTGPGIFGNRTQAAVSLFQDEHKLPVTGIVDDKTLSALKDAAAKAQPLPPPPPDNDPDGISTVLPENGVGYRTYNREPGGRDQVGLRHVIDAVIHLGKKWHQLHPECPFQVGDMSRKNGAKWPNNEHKSHRRGVDVDVRPFRRDHKMLPTTCNSTGEYGHDLSKDFVRLVKREFPGTVIFFNDSKLVSFGLTKHVNGHHNHFHIRFL
jgi:peptidoglycan hydrolase-like protein with peptidoglycan-binding domain